MLTPQEITDKVFVKAVIGGYDMKVVDDFLESVCADYTALYKENAILKGKLKVLVEKVEEYRSTEDSMRMALLTAQRMGEEITTEANKMKEETLRNADLEIQSRLAETARRIADEELRLNVAAKETGKFIELSQAIMRKHSEFLSRLETARRAVLPNTQVTQSSESVPEPVPIRTREDEIADTADMIGDAMERLTSDITCANADYEEYILDSDDIADDSEQAAIEADEIYDNEDTVTPRPRFDFDDLRFGSNLTPDDDDEKD